MRINLTKKNLINSIYMQIGFSKKISDLIKAGVRKSNIVVDPGIGFGKTLSDNLNILQYLHYLVYFL